MQARKSGRRKSIMIVEKDRTQEEIDKKPDSEKEDSEREKNGMKDETDKGDGSRKEEEMSRKEEEMKKKEEEMKRKEEEMKKKEEEMKNIEKEMKDKDMKDEEIKNEMKDKETNKEEANKEEMSKEETNKEEKEETNKEEKGSPDNKKKVQFDESRNQEINVSIDPSKSVPPPAAEQAPAINTGAVHISMLQAGSELFHLRTNNRIAVEGPISKRMFIFSCFWHERYFVLTTDGLFMYYSSLTGNGKGRISMRNVTEIRRINEESGSTRRYKLMIKYNGYSKSVRFNDENVRDYWNDKMRAVKEQMDR